MAGIPLTVAIRTISEKNDPAGEHKFYAQVGKQEPVPEETGQDAIEVDYFKEIEADFSQEAERILERLNLAHMRPKELHL